MRIPRLAAVALATLLLLAMPGSSSLVEESTGHVVTYQFDGDNHHDAPDDCEDSTLDWHVPYGNETDGMLVPPDDVTDVFRTDIPASAVGTRVAIRLTEEATGMDLVLAALMPGCEGSILDPRFQPTPEPTPAAPTASQVQASLDQGTAPHHCGSVWYFLVTGLQGAAPASLHAAWTDGTQQTSVPLSFQYNGYALYRANAAAVELKGAWLNLPAGWTGDFILAAGPCNAPHGGAVYGDPAVQLGDLILFTPIRSGPHHVVVSVAPPELPNAVTMSCHYCLAPVGDIVQRVSYFISVDAAA